MALWADLLLAAWVAFVAVVYYGTLWQTHIGAYTAGLSAVYGGLLVVAIIIAFLRFSESKRSGVKDVAADGKRS